MLFFQIYRCSVLVYMGAGPLFFSLGVAERLWSAAVAAPFLKGDGRSVGRLTISHDHVCSSSFTVLHQFWSFSFSSLLFIIFHMLFGVFHVFSTMAKFLILNNHLQHAS